jgi:DNA-3-methyladenine glycosylase II
MRSDRRMKKGSRQGRKAAGEHDGGDVEAVRLRACLSELYVIDPSLRVIETEAGPLPFRRRPEGFAALTRTLLGQQLSPAAAEAIFRRLEVGGELTPDYFRTATDAQLRGIGLSRQKIAYCRGLAEAVVGGTLCFEELRRQPDETAIASLVALKGIGRWTAEIYLLFAVGREDVWPAGDLALQHAIMRLRSLPSRPGEKDMRSRGEAWRPHRSAAARLLWHYHGWLKRAGDVTLPV